VSGVVGLCVCVRAQALARNTCWWRVLAQWRGRSLCTPPLTACPATPRRPPRPHSTTHHQLHSYHGGLSLMYIPERLRPAVLYVAHNAHYDAVL
jgi:hypothetical protein